MGVIKNKKGDLTSTQIIMLVIAIIGFVIVLLALYLVNLGGYSDEEICKLSVLTRATAPDIAQSAVPLKCQTSKICLTESYFGGCEEQFAGEENIEYVRLSGNVADKRRTIEETSANAMYDCWSMMGEGKLDLFANAPAEFGLKVSYPTCVICSRVAVDRDVDSAILTEYDSAGNAIGGVDVNNYLKTHQVPGQGFTYLQAFTDRGVSAFANAPSSFDQTSYNKKVTSGTGLGDVLDELDKSVSSAATASKTENREMAFVFMQIKSQGIDEVVKNMAVAGGTVGAATFVSPAGKIATTIGKRILFTPWGAAAAVLVAGSVVGYGAYNAYQGQLAAAGYCGSFASSTDAKKGCSMVQGLNYNFREVNSVCTSIQGEL